MKRICKFCNKEFDAKPKEINRGRGKFCTHKCYTLWNRGKNNANYKEKIKRICLYCHKEFCVVPSAIKKGGGKFCSRKCAAGGGEVKRICETCGKIFYVPPRTIKRGDGKFCSRSCATKSKVGSLSPTWKGGLPHCRTCGKLLSDYVSVYCKSCCKLGDKANAWIDGRSYEPYPPNFNNQLKARIRVRDNFICQRCGVPELECDKKLAIHHIDYNKKNCREDNLTALCCSCNSKVNTNREYWTNYFQCKWIMQEVKA